MKAPVYNQKGEKVGTCDLPDRMFGVSVNPDVVHQALVAHYANSRTVLAHTKGRGEVRGGGRKPWAQKGTGRARHGSIRSPIWRGGGVTFGPRKGRNFLRKINKKQKQRALAMALSAKVKDKELAVLDALSFAEPKTKTMAELVRAFRVSVFQGAPHKKVLLVTPQTDRNVRLSVRNLPHAKVMSADSLNVYDLLAHAYVVVTKDAVEVVNRTYKQIL